MTPTITVCADASVHPKHHIAAWACYIRLPNKTIKTSSVLKSKLNSSTDAEMQGLANALFILNSQVDLSKYRLILYSDNLHALGQGLISKKGKKTLGKVWRDFFNENILAMAEQAGSYEFRHVKAHLRRDNWSKVSQRHFMQDWCDKESRRIMRQELKLIKSSSIQDDR